MCNFKSAIVTKSGDIFIYPDLDSHTDIRHRAGIPEAGISQHFREAASVPVEFIPPKGVDPFDFASYVLVVDAGVLEPDWWTREFKVEIEERIRKWVVDQVESGLWPGILDLSDTQITSLPDGLNVGGYIYYPGITEC